MRKNLAYKPFSLSEAMDPDAKPASDREYLTIWHSFLQENISWP
ncbi:MAG: hypothetical protein OEZ36_11735 [Spirochaetota bacterium]|nr:hypothetical protein [Spirochaetota bacterium]